MMFQFNLFLCISCVFYVLSKSEETLKTVNECQTELGHSDEQKHLDLKRRKEIVHELFDTLTKAKETWVDPYQMITYPLKEQLVDESKDESLFNLDNEEEPVFSDIKGDVIGAKTLKSDNSMEDRSSETGGNFFKDRQQICVLDSIYISRWFKMLILKAEEESDLEPSSVSFPLDADLLDSLRELSTAKSLEIAQLDEFLSNMIALASVSRKENYDWSTLIDFLRKIAFVIGVSFCVLLFVYALYQCMKYHMKFTIVILVLVSSVFWHWMHLYHQKLAHKHAEISSMSIPNQCRKYDFGLIESVSEYFRSYFTKSNECATYYEALLVDPFWEVSITVAASEAIASMLFQPLSAASRIINTSLKQLFDDLSITITIPLVLLLFLLVIMMCNYRIKFPLFMGALEPHAPNVGICTDPRYFNRIEDVQPDKSSLTDAKCCRPVQKLSKSLVCRKNHHHENELSFCNQDPEKVLSCCNQDVKNDCDEVAAIISEEPCYSFRANADIQHQHEDCNVCNSESSENGEEMIQRSSETRYSDKTHSCIE